MSVDEDIVIEVTDDLLLEVVESCTQSIHAALRECPTKRVEPSTYREAQEEARLAAREIEPWSP